MRRRAFLQGLAGVVAYPAASVAQQQALPTIGLLNSGPPQPRPDQIEPFYRGLREEGFVVGDTVAEIRRGANDDYSRLGILADELVRQRVNVIAAIGGPVTALAAKQATSSIPVVFCAVSDPVKSGLVTSLARPTGNVTGSAGLATELDAKRFDILVELVPGAKAFGAMVNPNRPGVEQQEQDMRAAAGSAARDLLVLRAGDAEAIDSTFAAFAARGIEAVVIGADPFFANRRRQIVDLAARHRLAAIYQWREFASDGGLVSYGPDIGEAYRHSGRYVGRILKGARPVDLPVVQPATFELVLNQRTARALGLAVPPALLARADEIIE